MTDTGKTAPPAEEESIEARLSALRDTLFVFRGRYGRRKFWLGALVLLGLAILMIIPLASMNMPTGDGGAAGLAVLLIPFLWVYIKLIVHRLHDLGWSAWWVLLLGPLLIPLPTWMWIEGHTQEAYMRGLDAWLEFGAYGIFIGGFVLLGCLRGTEGPNRYGPDPLERRWRRDRSPPALSTLSLHRPAITLRGA